MTSHSLSPFAAIKASTLMGRLSRRFKSVFMGIFYHSSRSAFVRSGSDVGREGLAQSLHSKVFCWVEEVRTMCSPVKSLPHQTRSSMSLWTLLCALVCGHVGTGRGHPQTVPTKLGARNCPKCLVMLKH